MKSTAIFLFFQATVALKNARVDIRSVRCANHIDALDCSQQCTSNGCPGAKTAPQLDSCLRKLPPLCKVEVSGDVSATLQETVDFCTPFSEPGFLINIPRINGLGKIENKTLGIPAGKHSSMGEDACNTLLDQIEYRASSVPSTIENNICLSSVDLGSPLVHSARLVLANGNQFPLKPLKTATTLFVSLAGRTCQSRVEQILFKASFTTQFNGQNRLDLAQKIKSGTLFASEEPQYANYILPSPAKDEEY